MSTSYQRDSRGVLRGRCKDCGCSAYDGGEVAMKCILCDHPPGKHHKMNPDTNSHPGDDIEPMDMESEASIEANQPPFSGEATHLLSKCSAEGCDNPAYCDEELPLEMQMFMYCGPKCRDAQLGGVKEQLNKEIEQLEEELRSQKTPLGSPHSKTKKKASTQD